jgi:hypothetical protein
MRITRLFLMFLETMAGSVTRTTENIVTVWGRFNALDVRSYIGPLVDL